jgi:hypothetical protein
MQPLDFKALDEEQLKVVEQFLLRLRQNGYTRNEFDYSRWQMDCAVKQEFLESSYQSQGFVGYNLTGDEVSSLTGFNSAEYSPDVYSDLFHPLMVKFIGRIWLT